MEQRLDIPKVRTSERTTLMRCPQRWWWAYEERLKPYVKSAPLAFGSLIHEALAAYYIPEPPRTMAEKPRRGPNPVATFIDLYDQQDDVGGFPTDQEDWVDARELGIEMLTNYMDLYGVDRQFRVIAPELPFQIVIYQTMGKRKVPMFMYVGTFDALIEDLRTSHLGFFEHKTARSIVTGHLPMDEQAGSYWTYGPEWLTKEGYMQPGQRLDFILYNFLRKGKKDNRPRNEAGQYLNKDGSISKKQPAPLFKRELVYREDASREHLHQRVLHQFADMQAMRSGERPVTKNILNGCVGLYSCDYRDMCEMHEIGGDWESLRDSLFEVWDPYEAHDEKGQAPE